MKLRALCVLLAASAPLAAHDLERTQVSIIFARDGSFVVDVKNDPSWLKLRLQPFARVDVEGRLGARIFIDRVVLLVDGHEVRPTSAEYIAGPTLGTYRLRGRMPLDAHTMRWYYGLVVDPYPLTVRRADGRVLIEEIGGDAWSRTIDVSGQFQTWRLPDAFGYLAIVTLLGLLGLARFLSLTARSTAT